VIAAVFRQQLIAQALGQGPQGLLRIDRQADLFSFLIGTHTPEGRGEVGNSSSSLGRRKAGRQQNGKVKTKVKAKIKAKVNEPAARPASGAQPLNA
jgi:hypothetical protein